MKRIAYLLVASALSLTALSEAVSAQDFQATGHGSFDNAAIEISEAITSPLPPMPGQSGIQGASITSVAPDVAPSANSAITVPTLNTNATQVSAHTYVTPMSPGNQNFGAQNFGGQVFSSPAEIQVIADPNSQSNVVLESQFQQAPQSQVQQDSQFIQSGAPQQQFVQQQQLIMQPQQSTSSCGCQGGCADGSCESFVIDESQLAMPQRRVRARQGKVLNRPVRQQRVGRAVGQRSNGSVFSTVGVSGLLFNRNHGTNRDFSTNAAGDLMSSENATNDVLPGIDAFIARRKASGRGWEARYFGLYPDSESIQISNVTNNLIPGLSQVGTALSGPGPTAFLVGPSANSFYSRADTHVLTRQTELNNIEFNLLKSSQPRFAALSTEYLLGVRFFQFGETLLHEAINVPNGDPTFAGPDSVGYFSSVENKLVGLQLGARSDYQLRNRLMLHVGLKAGAFNNTVNTRQRVDYRMPDGSVINPTVAGGTLSGQPFDIGTENDVKSILGEVDVALSLQMSNSARIRIGYRALGLTDIAFASDQIQDDFTDASALATPNTDNNLVTQGGYVGLELAY